MDQVNITSYADSTPSRLSQQLKVANLLVNYAVVYPDSNAAPDPAGVASTVNDPSFGTTFTSNLVTYAAVNNIPSMSTLAGGITVAPAVVAVVTQMPTISPTAGPKSSDDSDKKLSPGSIAAAVIMTLFGAAVIVGLVWYCSVKSPPSDGRGEPSVMRNDDNVLKEGEITSL
jgi:hypothetical protein